MVDDPHADPTLFVITTAAPAGALQTRIIGLSHIDVRHQDRARGRFPRSVRRDESLASILIGDLDLQEESPLVAVQIPASCEGEKAPVPAVADRDPDSVVSFLERFGHIVHLVLESVTVTGPAWSEYLVTYGLAVELHLIETETRHKGPGRLYGSVQSELFPIHPGRLGHVGLFVSSRRYPVCPPVARLQQTHLPERGPAPVFVVAALVPDPNAPVASLSTGECRPLILHVNGPIRVDSAAIPE